MLNNTQPNKLPAQVGLFTQTACNTYCVKGMVWGKCPYCKGLNSGWNEKYKKCLSCNNTGLASARCGKCNNNNNGGGGGGAGSNGSNGSSSSN